jgi:PAS domain S-box-containing protein
MYFPVYRKHAVVSTIEQRRSALVGWVFSAYRMNDLMRGILVNGKSLEATNVALKVFDGDSPSSARLLFASDTAGNSANAPADASAANSLLHQSRTIDYHSSQWLLEFDGSEAAAAISYASAWTTLAGGFLLSGLVFSLMLSVINTRANARRIADGLTDEIRSSEALLKESEFRWKFAIEGSGLGLWDWNLVDGTVFFSATLKEIVGYAAGDVFNRFEDWESRLHPDDKAEAVAAVHDHLDGRTYAYACEHRLLCKDGSYKWVLSRGLVVSRSEDGKPLRMIGTTTDIGERKCAEEALREQKEFFHLIAENLGDFIAVLDVDGRRLYNSPSYQQFFDARVDLTGTDSFAEVHPDDRERVRRAFSESVETGIGRQIDYRFLRADGSIRDMESVGSVIKDDEGRVARVVVVSHDVTERKQAEKSLRESEEFKDIVLNSVPAEIAVVDKKGVILAVNEQWRNFAEENGVATVR